MADLKPPPVRAHSEHRHQLDAADAAQSTSTSQLKTALPPYVAAQTARPPTLPRHHLDGTQDLLELFNLVPIYDRSVRPYLLAHQQQQQQQQAAGQGQQGQAAGTAGAGTPLPFPLSAATQASLDGNGDTPATFGGGGAASPPSASGTGASAVPGAAETASTAAGVKKTKPPATYAHYLSDVAGRVKPPSKRARALKPERNTTTLLSILHKPEYTPQRIAPFDGETLRAAFSVESGAVEEIDQSLLEPDEEEAPRKKKKKRDKVGTAGAGGGGGGATTTPAAVSGGTPRGGAAGGTR